MQLRRHEFKTARDLVEFLNLGETISSEESEYIKLRRIFQLFLRIS